jgi:hypothetical protein
MSKINFETIGDFMDDNKCTLREAMEKFPNLFDELVTWGMKNNEPFLESTEITFQFCGDGNQCCQP